MTPGTAKIGLFARPSRLLLSFCSAFVPGLKFGIFPAEPLNTTGRIYEFLFPGKKRMTLGANFNPDVLLGGTYLNHVAACTMNLRLKKIRMYAVLHLAAS